MKSSHESKPSEVNPPVMSSLRPSPLLTRLILPSQINTNPNRGRQQHHNLNLLKKSDGRKAVMLSNLPTRPTGHRSRVRGRTVAFGRPRRTTIPHPLLPQTNKKSADVLKETLTSPNITLSINSSAVSPESTETSSVFEIDKDAYIYCLVHKFYTLEPVTREQAVSHPSGEFCRRSKQGVIRTYSDQQGRSVKEFTNMKRWYHEAHCYSAMQKLDFFRQGLPRRAFQNWVIVVRRKKFERAKKKIKEHWFAVHSALSKPLQQMWQLRLHFLKCTRESILAFKTLRQVMMGVKSGNSSSDQLRTQLLNSEASGICAIEKFVKSIQTLVFTTLRMILSKGLNHQTLNNNSKDRVRSSSPSSKYVSGSGSGSGSGGKNPVSTLKYDLPRRLVHEIRRFIRLIDCIASCTLIRGCIEKQYILHVLLHKGRHQVDRHEAGKREFLIQMQVHTNMERRSRSIVHRNDSDGFRRDDDTDKDDDSTKLEPSLKMINKLLLEVEKHYLSCVLSVKRLSGQINLERTLRDVRSTAKKTGYGNGEVPESAIVMSQETLESDHTNLVQSTSVLKHLEWIDISQKNRASIKKNYNAMLVNSRLIVGDLLSFGSIDHHQERELPSVQVLQKQIRDGQCPLDDISMTVKTLQAHRKELQRIETIIHMGPLTTNLQFVQENEMQRTKDDLKQLSKLLPLLLERECLAVRDEVLSLQGRIDNDIETLRGASATILITMTISSRIEALRESELDARRLSRLLDELNLRPSEEAAACLPTLGTLLDQLNASLYGLLSRKEDTIAHWRLHIDARVSELQSETLDLTTELTQENSFIIDPSSEPQDALASLDSTLDNAEKMCDEAKLLYDAEQIFSTASPEDSKNVKHRRQTLIDETKRCCVLLSSTREMVETIAQLHTLTLKLRKKKRIVAERAVVGEQAVDLSVLHNTAKQLIEVTQQLSDTLNLRTSELCEARAREAMDSTSVVCTIRRISSAVQGDLSVDHRDEIIEILHPDKHAFRPAIASAAKLKGLGWIRVKDLYNVSMKARASIDLIIFASESEAALREKFVKLVKDWNHTKLTFSSWQGGTMSTLELTEEFAQYLEDTEVVVSTLIRYMILFAVFCAWLFTKCECV